MSLSDFFKIEKNNEEQKSIQQSSNTTKKIQVEENLIKSPKTPQKNEEEQIGGQLAIDLYEDDEYFVIQSTIAGLKPDEIDIQVDDNIITIKGERTNPVYNIVENKNVLLQECYWGFFKREVMLPSKINPDGIKASFKNGVLTIIIPKAEQKKKRKISIEED